MKQLKDLVTVQTLSLDYELSSGFDGKAHGTEMKHALAE